MDLGFGIPPNFGPLLVGMSGVGANLMLIWSRTTYRFKRLPCTWVLLVALQKMREDQALHRRRRCRKGSCRSYRHAIYHHIDGIKKFHLKTLGESKFIKYASIYPLRGNPIRFSFIKITGIVNGLSVKGIAPKLVGSGSTSLCKTTKSKLNTN